MRINFFKQKLPPYNFWFRCLKTVPNLSSNAGRLYMVSQWPMVYLTRLLLQRNVSNSPSPTRVSCRFVVVVRWKFACHSYDYAVGSILNHVVQSDFRLLLVLGPFVRFFFFSGFSVSHLKNHHFHIVIEKQSIFFFKTTPDRTLTPTTRS